MRYSQLAPVSRYWAKLRQGYFQIPDFWSNPKKTVITPEPVAVSNDIDMKLRPVTKLYKRTN